MRRSSARSYILLIEKYGKVPDVFNSQAILRLKFVEKSFKYVEPAATVEISASAIYLFPV